MAQPNKSEGGSENKFFENLSFGILKSIIFNFFRMNFLKVYFLERVFFEVYPTVASSNLCKFFIRP